MKTAFLFPGQGSQRVGMASDLYDAFPEAAELVDAADELLDIPLKDLMFGAGGEADAEQQALTETSVTQPALYVHSMAAVAVLRARGLQPDVGAGHSLGEYSALAAAGALSFEDGLRLVRLRGRLMGSQEGKRPGAMAAVLNLEADVLDGICGEVSAEGIGVVQAANYNSPGQIVISGDAAAVEAASERAREGGARRVVMLPVSGAFHSPLMEHAREGLAEALKDAQIRTPSWPVYLNVTAGSTTDPDEIRLRLLEQLTAPVRWAQMLETMRSDGVERFVEVGAGNVLAGLVKRTLGREVETATVGTATELDAFLSSPTAP